jgi:hypothetical protein
MTALESLNARPAAIQRSPRSAPARNAKMRLNSDPRPQDTPPKMQNKPAFHSAAGVRVGATVTLRPSGVLISHLAPIEIP